METLQNYVRNFFRIGNSNRNSKTSNEAFIRIRKKIRCSKLKETIELFTEIFLLLLTIMLLVIGIYYFFLFELRVL